MDYSTAVSAVYLLKERSKGFGGSEEIEGIGRKPEPSDHEPLRLDQAGENVSSEFKVFVMENRMTFEFSPAYVSQLNGFSERLIKALWKMARSMLFESRMDMKLWGGSNISR